MDNPEELLLDLLGDGAAVAFADLVAVNGAYRGDLGSGAAHEYLIGKIESLAGDELLAYLVAKVTGNMDDGVAGDAGQNGGCR